jgi:hypothetical protein
MNLIEITPEIVRDYWEHMCKLFGIRVKKKTGSLLMPIARLFAGIAPDVWAKFSTIIGHILYTDVEPGREGGDVSLLGQICLITHECQHVVQCDRDCLYSLQYLLSSKSRAEYETDAYTCNLEMYRYFTGGFIPVSAIVEKLKLYKLTRADLATAEKTLNTRTEMIRYGGNITAASLTAAVYFSMLVSRLKAKITTSRSVADYCRVI